MPNAIFPVNQDMTAGEPINWGEFRDLSLNYQIDDRGPSSPNPSANLVGEGRFVRF